MNKIETFQLFKNLTVAEQMKVIKSLNATPLAPLSAVSGLSMSHISNFLNGHKQLKVDAVEAMAEMLGYKIVLVPISELDGE